MFSISKKKKNKGEFINKQFDSLILHKTINDLDNFCKEKKLIRDQIEGTRLQMNGLLVGLLHRPRHRTDSIQPGAVRLGFATYF